MQLLHKHTKVTEMLLAQGPWDLFVCILTVTDAIQHSMWKHWDPNHPDHDQTRSPRLCEIFGYLAPSR
jgi:predicted AlkP superfamily phosphohydrolase/phosphomutase